MKKTLIAIAALAAALVGCTQYEGDQIATSDAIEGKSFVATIDDAETRTLLDAENKVNWEKGDCLSVFDGDDFNLKFEAKIADDQEFSKTADMSYVGWEESYGGTGLATGGKYSIFPFAEDNAIDAETKVISFTMPETVSSAVRSIANLPLVAAGEVEGDLTYKIPAALVRVKVAKENRPTKVVLKTLTLSSRENQPLSGRATVDMSAEPYKVTIAADAENVSNKVTLDFGEEGLVLNPEHQVLYFAIPETAFKANDLMISYTGTYSASAVAISGEFKLKKAIEFKAGKVEQTSITITSASWSGSTDETPVASVNGVKFITLEEAFMEAIGLGGEQTISMLSPAVVENAIEIPAGSKISLILNGNEVTTAIEGVAFTNKGEMTITDGTITAEKDLFRMESGSTLTVGAGATLVSNTDAVIYAPAGATDVTINVIGTVENKTDAYAAIQTNATTAYPTGNTINIVEGAVVKSEGAAALYCPGSDIVITGGEISGYTAIYHKKGSLSIEGGTFTANGEKKDYQYNGNGWYDTGDAIVIEACEVGGAYAPCSLEITGGTFVSENAAAIAYYKQDVASVNEVEYTITGGIYSTDPTALLTNAYRADVNDEGMFEVVVDVVAIVNGVECTTLQEAINAANAGDTITILGNNVEEETIVVDKNITIDGTKVSTMKKANALKSNAAAVAAYTIESYASPVFEVKGGVKLTVQNLAITSTEEDAVCFSLVGEGAELTLNNVTFEGTLFEEKTVDANTITVDGVRQVNGDKQLKDALLNWDVEEVKVNVLNDVTLNIGTENVFGSDQTTAVNIEGNGKTLTFEDSYRTYVKSKGVLTLNNLNISRKTSSTSTHWHNNNMKFCTPVVMNEVTFDKGICLDGAQTFELNKVTINKSQVGTYALWIVAGGDVTLNDLTINATADGARGIKIGDEDAGNKEALTKLTINGATFDTKQKAAILVSSKGGAEIVAQNLNIEKVAADTKYAVWVDEDWAEYYDLVTVTGCLKWVEGDIEYVNGGLIYRKKADLYEVYNAEGLFYIANDVNNTTPYTVGNFTGKLVKLMNDIDLKNAEWTPIGDDRSARTEWEGIFDGQNHTISNFQITKPTERDDANKSSYGFFGNVEGTVKNLTIKNANVDLTGEAKGKFAAALVGRLNDNGWIDNCHVVDSNVAIDNWTVGGIVSQVYKANITNSTITNSTITGYAAAGAVAGIILGDVENTIENCKVENCKIVQNGYFGDVYDEMFGVIAGAIYSGEHTTYFNNNQMLGTNTFNGVATDKFLGYYADGDKAYIDNRLYITYGAYLNGDVYEIENVNGLQWFAKDVNGGNNYNKETVRLMADLDLNNEEWTPIGMSDKPFQGTFDGQNYTISNLLITGNNSNVGLFGYTNGYNGTIKNLTVENAKVSGYLNVGVVAGTPYTTKYNNITVKGHVEVNGFSYVGAVGGKNAYADWTDITVDVDDSSYVNANSIEDGTNYRTYVGGVVGFMGEGTHKFTNVKSNIDVTGTTCDVGGIVGIAHEGNQFINCSASGDVTITNATTRAEEIGGIAGVWMNNGRDVVFDGCEFTGNLSANVKSVDLDDNTIVGAPYHKSQGNNYLVINNNARQYITDGAWVTKAGEYELENKNALYWFADQVNVEKNEFRGETVKLMNDIVLTGMEWTPIGVEAGERYSGLFYGTFDGMGHKITNMVVNQEKVAGFFGMLHSATVKNLRIGAATVNSNHYAGGICGWAESGAGGVTFDNCEVYGSKITSTVKDNDNGDKVGGIVGYAYYNTINNCRVFTNTTITGYRDLGGIAGFAKGSSITNCYVKNAIINVDNSVNYDNKKIQSEYNVGEIYGRCDGVEPNIEGTRVAETVINWGVIPPYLPGGSFGGSADGEDIEW